MANITDFLMSLNYKFSFMSNSSLCEVRVKNNLRFHAVASVRRFELGPGLIYRLNKFSGVFLLSELLAHWLLTLDFKLAFFRMLFEVDEDADDEEEKNCGHGSTSDTRRLEHDTRSSSCCEKIIFSLDSSLALSHANLPK